MIPAKDAKLIANVSREEREKKELQKARESLAEKERTLAERKEKRMREIGAVIELAAQEGGTTKFVADKNGDDELDIMSALKDLGYRVSTGIEYGDFIQGDCSGYIIYWG